MKITEVVIYLKNGRDIKGFANIVFEDSFIVRGFRIKEDKNGHYIQMPNKKDSNRKIVDVAHPTNKETYHMIETAILDQYEIEINKDHTTDATETKHPWYKE